NSGAVIHSSGTPDAIELYNPGPGTAQLDGLRLSNNKDFPNLFTFPSNTTLGAGFYLIVYADFPDGSPDFQTGFTLDAEDDAVYLFSRATDGDVVLDFVNFGPQLQNFSIGRTGTSGTWQLTQPTFLGANIPVTLGDPNGLRINEWLAAGNPGSEDFIELYNPAALPVSLGGLYLTDKPIGAPTFHRIADLSFIPANGFVAFTADADDTKANHVGFQLGAEQGEIALHSVTSQRIDYVVYGAQLVGVSMGRCPDGSVANLSLAVPTPSFFNACPAAPSTPQSVTLISYSDTWRYNQTSNLYATNWTEAAYPDSAWPNGGPGALASGGISGVAVNTLINNTTGTVYFRATFVLPTNANFTSILLSHFVDDGAVVYVNGKEAYRYNMNSGGVGHATRAASNNTGEPLEVQVANFPLTNAFPGTNILAVSLHPRPDVFIGGDAVMGLKLEGLIVTNSASAAGVVINEVLAENASQAEPDGSTPDWIELYNPSIQAVDLSDMSMTDSLTVPRRWVFPSGSIIDGLGFFRVRFDADLPASSTNTGWGLSADGDSVFLINKPSAGGVRDAITFGLQIPDHSISRLPSGSNTWNLSLPTIGSANIGVTLGNQSLLRVNEWMANPVSGEDDFIELYNPEAQPVVLGGLLMSDTFSQRDKHVIRALSFIGAVTNAWKVFKADGNTTLGAEHLGFSLRAQAEDVVLSFPNQALIDGISFTNAVENVSEGRLSDGSANIVKFNGTASPGSANYQALTNVAINEVLTHSDPPLEDAIELRNLTGSPLDIGGWWLSDSQSDPQKFQIPAGTVLAPFGFAVFYENQFNNIEVAAQPFSLSSANGDEVYLSKSDSNGVLAGFRAQVDFGPAVNGVSFGRYVNSVGSGEFVVMAQRTFGIDSPTTVEQFRTSTGKTNTYPLVGPIVITEVMYHPPNLQITNDNTRDEFVEIRNIAGTNVTLYDPAFPTNRWRLRGGVDFDFPAIALAPGTTLVVVSFDPATDPISTAAFRGAYALPTNAVLFGPWSGQLANSSESVELKRPDAPQTTGADAGLVPYVLVDRVQYGDVAPWPTSPDGLGSSLHRVSNTGYGNDPTNWFAAAATPAPPVTNGDSDSDGMPDTWELDNGLDHFDASDAHTDLDDDGASNLQEYLAGTNPQSALSVLKLAISITPATAARLSFTALSNYAYSVQSRTSLSTGSWLNLQSVPSAPNDRAITITNEVPPPRFYRIITP
ncbi:MAG TPA: lamin tail domain-containing protein, partial [Candidatus Acidoferrum sp.]|nr:lamin tail domain-containing protein [Candidatus Acidoferrum sp.]